MSDLAIEVDRLSKRYRIGVKNAPRASLAQAAVELLMQPFQNLKDLNRLTKFEDTEADRPDVIWALRDVSFNVNSGEVVGIIGRNGSGKSTLLKILTQIAKPTSGRARIRGSVSSLLEVGTGFHPELTGRENVYLNGAVLGMGHREISRKFDEIVAFSGVERFMETPVKRYSTGMKVRLAFSVAAHLEPDILLVDEVLSVGDADFQKRCLGKMDDVARKGRTVLFVSHNLSAVTRLCERIIYLEDGRLMRDGPAHEVMTSYLTSGQGSMAAREWPEAETAPGGEIARLRAGRIVDESGKVSDAIDIRRPFRLEMEYEVLRSGFALMPNFTVWNSEEGVIAFSCVDLDHQWRGKPRPVGRYRTSAWIPGNLLSEGMFTVDASLATASPVIAQFQENSTMGFHVIDAMEGVTARGDYAGRMAGVVRPMLEWETAYLGTRAPREHEASA